MIADRSTCVRLTPASGAVRLFMPESRPLAVRLFHSLTLAAGDKLQLQSYDDEPDKTGHPKGWVTLRERSA
jgi:hypothetical protein